MYSYCVTEARKECTVVCNRSYRKVCNLTGNYAAGSCSIWFTYLYSSAVDHPQLIKKSFFVFKSVLDALLYFTFQNCFVFLRKLVETFYFSEISSCKTSMSHNMMDTMLKFDISWVPVSAIGFPLQGFQPSSFHFV